MYSQEREFQKTVLLYYKKHGRHDLPWRLERTPFNAFLSETMLQQTQVPRVIEKFNLFRSHFSSFEELAHAPQSQIVSLWQGLGYNRRALYLHRSAQLVVEKFGGYLPASPEELLKLPGIGPATARSLSVYAFNTPVPFIETNIRAVYIHHFFQDREGVHDSELLPIVEKTLDQVDPYQWYSALMDYGTMLKSKHNNPARKSYHHVKQSKFEGSKRQIRGKVIRLLSEIGDIKKEKLLFFLRDDRAEAIVKKLVEEKMVEERRGSLSLKH